MAKDEKDQGPRDDKGRKLYKQLDPAAEEGKLRRSYEADAAQRAQGDMVDTIMAHLGDLFDKRKGSKSAPILKSFQELAGDEDLNPATIRAIFKHVSKTGKDEVGDKKSKLWHFFEDVFSKTTDAYNGLPAEQKLDPVLDVIVVSRWNAANFPKIMGYKEASSLPSFPARVEELKDFRAIPSYIEKVVMPILKAGIAERLGISAKDVEERVNAREQELICNKVPFYEAIMPIEASTPRAKGGKPSLEIGSPK